MIIAAAIVIDEKTRALPAPARHHDIIAKYPKPDHKQGAQGFIDDQQGFVGRIQAGDIARSEGQIKELKWPPYLYSEDLW